MGSKFKTISDVPCSVLLFQNLFHFPGLILVLYCCLCTKKLLLTHVYCDSFSSVPILMIGQSKRLHTQ